MAGKSDKYISVNIKKIKAATSVKNLTDEYFRDAENAQKYDDGHRNIDITKTRDNVILIAPPDQYDRVRRDRIQEINDARSRRGDPRLQMHHYCDKLRESGDYRAAKNRDTVKTSALRKDTVDTLTMVVQASAPFMASLSRAEQIKFYSDAVEIMQDYPDWFGTIDMAVIHMDETNPHLQVMASALNFGTLTGDATKIVGNKSKMSDRQTLFAGAMRARGWDVERGIKRVDNPDYQNFRDDVEMAGISVNRHNDAILMAQWDAIKAREMAVQGREASIQAVVQAVDARRAEIARMDAKMAKITQNAQNAVKQAQDARQGLDARDRVISARERALDAREHDLDARAGDLDRRAQKLDAMDQAIDAGIDQLNELMAKNLRMTRAQKVKMHDDLQSHMPVDRDGLVDLGSALDQINHDADDALSL